MAGADRDAVEADVEPANDEATDPQSGPQEEADEDGEVSVSGTLLEPWTAG